MPRDAQIIAEAEPSSNLPAADHTVTDADLVAAMNCRPELLNGCSDVLAPELFAEPMHRDIARLFLLGLRSPQIEQRIRDSGDYSEEQVTAEFRELDDLSLSLYSERIDRAAATLVDPRRIESRLSTFPTTDYGNAQRLVVRHGLDLRFTKAVGWLVWDGRRWRPNDIGEVERRAKHTVRCIYHEAAAVEDRKRREALASWAQSSESGYRLRNMIDLAWSEPGITVRPDQLDADPWLLNVLNGTINLRKRCGKHTGGRLREHRRGDLITKLAPVHFDAEASCPTFERFLDETTSGREDVAAYLQQFLGMCLTGDVREQVLPVWWGTGCNGKNTLIDPILAMMGDYAGKAAPELLVAHQWSTHPTEIADLFGKRLVVASETERGQRLRVQFVKAITGDATLKGRHMRQDFFEFTRTHKTILVTNNRPDVDEQTHAIWRRLQLVPFTNVVPDDQQDKELSAKLLAEAPGTLAWMVRGCLSWQKRGLIVPSDVLAATKQYRAECDHIAQFCDECLTFTPGAWTASSRLAEILDQWSRENAVQPNHRELKQRLRQKQCEPRSARQGRGWSGVGIVTDRVEIPD